MTNPGFGLGRLKNHDPRSRDFAHPEESLSTLKSAWHRSYIGIMDQKEVGACTGFSSTKYMTHRAFWSKTSNIITTDLNKADQYALGVYSDAEDVDGDGPYPPNDNGSSGLSVAKVYKNRGLISGYQHTFTFQSFLTALSRHSAIWGIKWYEDMFYPAPDGTVKIGGAFEGGHELCVDQVDFENKFIAGDNSWGPTWGASGRYKMSFDTAEQCLMDEGDCTVFLP